MNFRNMDRKPNATKVIFCIIFITSLLSFTIANPNKRQYKDQEFLYEFEIVLKKVILELEPNKRYFWFNGDAVKNTIYSYKGRLLNGEFKKSFLKSDNLSEVGSFSYGLKNGIWKKWNANGELKEVVNWEEGLKDGSYEFYDSKNKTKVFGSYKNNLKHGKWILLKGDVTEVKKWKKGKLDGVYKKIYKDSVVIKGKYSKGLKNGLWINHETKKKQKFKNDILIEDNVGSFWDRFKEEKKTKK